MTEAKLIESLKRYLAWYKEDLNLNPVEVLDWVHEDIEIYEKEKNRTKTETNLKADEYVQSLIERDTPKKVICSATAKTICPSCRKAWDTWASDFCQYCGQRIGS